MTTEIINNEANRIYPKNRKQIAVNYRTNFEQLDMMNAVCEELEMPRNGFIHLAIDNLLRV